MMFRKPDRAQQGREVLDKKIEIFEKAQDHKVPDDAQGQVKFPASLVPGAADPDAAKEIKEGGKNNQGKETPVPKTVKHVTGDKQHPVLPAVRQDKIQAVDNDKK